MLETNKLPLFFLLNMIKVFHKTHCIVLEPVGLEPLTEAKRRAITAIRTGPIAFYSKINLNLEVHF